MLSRRALLKRAAKAIVAVPTAMALPQKEQATDIETIAIRGGTARCGEQAGLLIPKELAEELKQGADINRIWAQEIIYQLGKKEDERRMASAVK